MRYYFRQHNVSHGFPKIASGLIFFKLQHFLRLQFRISLIEPKKLLLGAPFVSVANQNINDFSIFSFYKNHILQMHLGNVNFGKIHA